MVAGLVLHFGLHIVQGYKQHSCGNCVDPSCPQQWRPDLHFGASRPCGPAGCLALLLIKAGDVQTNPGPITTRKQVWTCDICHRQIHGTTQISIKCNTIEYWASTLYRYLDLPSTQIIQTHNTHRHNTTPSSQTLAQANH